MADPNIESGFENTATFQPQECSTKGGVPLLITFSTPLPNDPMVIILRGSEFTHKIQPERVSDTTISSQLPAHSIAEPVEFSVYLLPSCEESTTYQAMLLMEDTINYINTSQYSLLAEQLVQSVTDNKQDTFYSLLPPLVTMNISELCEFDVQLRDAVYEIELPKEWRMVNTDHTHKDTPIHFAAKYNLTNLFSLLITLPGGKDAISVMNSDGHYPIDLAKESGCHEITRIIESLDRVSSSLTLTAVSSVSLLEIKSSPFLNIMKEIDGDWIHRQQNKNNINGVNAPVSSKCSISSPPSSHRPNSIAVMEGLNIREDSPPSCWLCMKTKDRRKSWSRILGEGKTRSVDTGMNELDRITDQIHAHEKLQEVRGMLPSSLSTTKGEWLERWSFSCPSLNDDFDSVSNDLIHSTLTSPGLFDGPTFLSDFTTPINNNDNDHSNIIPHLSLLTSGGNYGNEEVCSISPSLVLPQVCVEDEHMRRVCMTMDGGTGGGDNSTLKANDVHLLQSSSDSINSSNSINSNDDIDTTKSPLSSKSAPALHSVDNDTESPDQHATPTKISKSYSTSTQGVLIDNRDNGDDDLVCRTRSAVFHSPSISPIHESVTPSCSPPTHHKKSHHKSLSVSNVPLDFEIIELSELDNNNDDNSGFLGMPDDTRSRGSSFISTSSKMDSSDDTSDTEEDDDFEPPLQDGPLLTGLKKIINNDHDDLSSEDDYLDGGLRVKGRTDRRFSEVKVTMIDDYSESDEDGNHFRPLPRSSTADDALSHTSHSTTDEHRNSSEERTTFPISKKNEIALSDIDVTVDSLNNSFSSEYSKSTTTITGSTKTNTTASNSSKTGMSPVFTRGGHSKGSFTPNGSPQLSKQLNMSDPKKTVTKLQSLLRIEQDDSSVFEPNSDDSDREGTPRVRKSYTLPSNSPGLQRRSPLLSETSFPTKKEHVKVTRNASTASDSKVEYKHAPEISSLDFIKSRDGHVSPRTLHHSQSDISSLQSPHSPLFFSKRPEDKINEAGTPSPKASGSPLEKRVSKSADNLLSDTINEENQEEPKTDNQSPSKAKKKEDNSVRLLRFEPLPEYDANTDEETNNKKDLKSYYGIEQEKEPAKKGAFKLFRRDSKKDKKPKKYDTSNSIDIAGNTSQSKSRTQPSPILRKPRSHTIHGEYPVTDDEPKELHNKRLSQSSINKQTTPTPQQRDSISPVREKSLSPVPLSPSDLGHSGENESDKSLSIKIEEFPELMPTEEADVSWNRTVDRRLRKQMSKHEKGRQGVIYDWITTERHIYRAYQILKRVFYDKFKSELKMSDDELTQLFPSLHTLLSISQEFIQRLQDRQRQSGTLIQDISDILHDQFTGAKGERMKKAYTHFICLYPATMELYRDMEKKRHKFNRLITVLYQNKVCERKKLPDFYLLITQRVSKYVEMMKKLVKETEAMKLDHLQRVREASSALKDLVNSIDRGVYEYNNRKELNDIQTRLELNLLKLNTKSKKLKGIKSLDFTAQNRFLLKRGEATWQGHGKQLGVQIILVTDLLALITERDQKFHLATLQDLQPPVIKLFDLHVRVNAAVKSGIQLLLLEQGVVPEMFRLEFSNKKLAKEWEESLNMAIDHCKENDLKCEYFGAEPVLSGDELTKEEEDEKGEGPDSAEPDPDLSPNSYRRLMVSMAIDQANRILSSGPTSSSSFGGSMMTIDEVKQSPRPNLKNNKPIRSTTLTQRSLSSNDEGKQKKKKSVERGRSFLEKKSSQSLEDQSDRQVLTDCISKLKESLEMVLEHSEELESVVSKLRKDIEGMKEDSRRSEDSSPATPRSQRGSSFSRGRPHSLHSDMFDSGGNN